MACFLQNESLCCPTDGFAIAIHGLRLEEYWFEYLSGECLQEGGYFL